MQQDRRPDVKLNPKSTATCLGLQIFFTLGFLAQVEAATLLVPQQYSSLQAAVNAAYDNDVILISPQIPPPEPKGEVDPTWYTETTTRIENKDITIQGTVENMSNPVTFHNDHFQKVLEIVGKSKVTLSWIKIDGASRAIDLIPANGQRPELTMSQVRITDAVVGINGEAKVVVMQNVGLSQNEGSAIKLMNFDSVSLNTVSANDNVSSGITLQGDPTKISEVLLQNVSATRNGFHGLWIHSFQGIAQLNGLQLRDNMEVQFVITDSNRVIVQGLGMNDFGLDTFIYNPDGLRISKSKVTMSGVGTEFYRSRLVQVLGCKEDTEVEVLVSSFLTQYFSDIWSSGQIGTCPTGDWNFFEPGAPADRFFADGFESTDPNNNHCEERETGETRQCRPEHVYGFKVGFGSPSFRDEEEFAKRGPKIRKQKSTGK
jgi:hypothetical protein